MADCKSLGSRLRDLEIAIGNSGTGNGDGCCVMGIIAGPMVKTITSTTSEVKVNAIAMTDRKGILLENKGSIKVKLSFDPLFTTNFYTLHPMQKATVNCGINPLFASSTSPNDIVVTEFK